MQFDARDDGWKPIHDPEMRLRSPWALAIALAMLALGAAGLMAVPSAGQKAPAAVAGTMR
jgi:hypothetical protein